MERLRPSEGQAETCSPLVQNLLRKKALLMAGDPAHEQIKTALIIDGGGMRGVFAGGVCTGLEEAGMRDVFDCVVGVSSGTAACAYFLAGQSRMGTSIYYEELASRRFINPVRLIKVLDIDFLDPAFRKAKPLDQAAVRRSRSSFFIGVTEANTGKGVFLDMKDPSLDIDIITAIRASSALPLVYNRKIAINGVEYCDGAIGCGLPIDFVLRWGCTDVLVVINRPFGKKKYPATVAEKLLSSLVMRNFPLEVRTAYLEKNRSYNDSLERAANKTGVNIGVLCPESMPLSRLSMDAAKMRDVARQGELQTLSLFR